MGRQPHPDNLRVSYGCELANLMGAILECDAESASSNDRILRTTYEYLSNFPNDSKPDLVIIGWSTWEREEWWDEDTQQYWQVNAGGIGDDWPDNIKEQYKNYIANLDMKHALSKAANKIWLLHQDLQAKNINHLFFNCFEPLRGMPKAEWNGCYLEPYNTEYTYYNWCINKGFKTVRPDSYHFGVDAHCAWAEFLYQHLVQKNLTQ